MKISKSILLGICIISAALQTGVAKAEHLVGSQWAQKFPGLLPYEYCAVAEIDHEGLQQIPPSEKSGAETEKGPVERMETVHWSPDFKFVYGHNHLPKSPFLACRSDRLDLSYAIPLSFNGPERTAGAVIDLFAMIKHQLVFKNLNDKKVKDLMGEYKGFSLGILLGLGGVLGRMKNHETGVKIDTLQPMIGLIGADVGKNWLHVSSRETISEHLCRWNLMVLSDTQQARGQENCDGRENALNWAQLGDLKFVKITKKNYKEFM